jgi:hypothetical protein
MRTPLVILGGVGWLAVAIVPAAARAGHVVIGSTDSFYDVLSVTALGARTSDTILSGAHCFGPRGVPGSWSRAIVPFSRSAFAPIADRPILAAKPLYVVHEDFLEPGETAVSEVRLFTTNEPPSLELENRDVFADPTGDGGARRCVAAGDRGR